MMHNTDIVIIGAGPVGIFTVFQAGMLGMKTHVIDALDFKGGQCNALYPDKPIYDIPGYSKITGKELINSLDDQASVFDPVYHLGQNVTEISGDAASGFTVKTKKEIINCKVIIIAAGAGLFEHRKPPLKDIDIYENISVFYSVNDVQKMRDKNIVIAGGGDSALDWAIHLADIAKSVHLVHRREEFKAFDQSLKQMHNLVNDGKITLHLMCQLWNLEGDNSILKRVDIKSSKGDVHHIDADILLPFFGLKHNVSYLKEWGLESEKNHIKIDHTTAQTNLDGIYAVGDIATYDNKLKLILTGFAEAASATHNAYNIVFDGKPLHFEHSTSKKIR